jgi:hypothetical protein
MFKVRVALSCRNIGWAALVGPPGCLVGLYSRGDGQWRNTATPELAIPNWQQQLSKFSSGPSAACESGKFDQYVGAGSAAAFRTLALPLGGEMSRKLVRCVASEGRDFRSKCNHFPTLLPLTVIACTFDSFAIGYLAINSTTPCRILKIMEQRAPAQDLEDLEQGGVAIMAL